MSQSRKAYFKNVDQAFLDGQQDQFIASLSLRASALETKADTLKDRADGLESRATAVEATVSTHTGNIAAIQTAAASRVAYENAFFTAFKVHPKLEPRIFVIFFRDVLTRHCAGLFFAGD